MSAVELVALAASVSLLAGWRLYLVTFVTGLAMKFGWIALPDQLQTLDVLANNWVIGIAGVGSSRGILRRQDRLGRQRLGRNPLASSGRLAARCSALAIVDFADPALAGRQLPARRRSCIHRPCRQGGRAHAGERQPRAGFECRRLDGRRCDDRRLARARHRHPDRGRHHRAFVGRLVDRGWSLRPAGRSATS